MSKSKKQVIPKLRFIDFKDDEKWNITTLGKLSIPVEDRAGEDSYTLMSVTSGIGLIPQIEKFGREIAGNSYKNYYVIQNSDFAYNKSATKLYPEGYIAMLQGYDNAALPNSIFTCFRIVDKESSPRFFNHLFSSNYHGKWLRKYITVGARANGALSIDNKYLWKMPVAVPKLNEQLKIADCLSSLDDLIRDESKKLLALKGYKKGLMQKLFPADGKSIPELRFPQFRDCGEWQERKFGDICPSIASGKSKKSTANGIYPLMGSTGQIGLCDTADYSGDLILIARVGANAGQVNHFVGECGVSDNTLILVVDATNINGSFLRKWLENFNINKLIFGSGQPLITGGQLKNIEMCVPDLKEQQKIADCLSSIDDLIIIQSKKIEMLKIHKKSLMQGLFTSAQEVVE